MTAEEIGYAIEILMEQGALDAYAENIVMKNPARCKALLHVQAGGLKKRWCVCCSNTRRPSASESTDVGDLLLARRFEQRKTAWGEVSVKVCEGYGVEKVKAEFEDLVKIAKEENLSIKDVKKGKFMNKSWVKNDLYIEKFLQMAIVLILLSTIVFVIARLAPAIPLKAYYGDGAEHMSQVQREGEREAGARRFDAGAVRKMGSASL